MGINIHLMVGGERRHPDWDWIRHSGDKQFVDWMEGLGELYREGADEDGKMFRPVNIDEWRAALPADRDNPDRFPKMFDILEREPDTWIYLSW